MSSNTGDSLSLQSAADGQRYGVDVNSHRIQEEDEMEGTWILDSGRSNSEIDPKLLVSWGHGGTASFGFLVCEADVQGRF